MMRRTPASRGNHRPMASRNSFRRRLPSRGRGPAGRLPRQAEGHGRVDRSESDDRRGPPGGAHHPDQGQFQSRRRFLAAVYHPLPAKVTAVNQHSRQVQADQQEVRRGHADEELDRRHKVRGQPARGDPSAKHHRTAPSTAIRPWSRPAHGPGSRAPRRDPLSASASPKAGRKGMTGYCATNPTANNRCIAP